MAGEPEIDPASSLLAFFGAEVLRLRTLRGWSQGELARRAHTTQTAISFVEGAKRVPTDVLASTLDGAFESDGHFARLHPLVLRYAYPSWFLPFVELEREATAMRVFESQIIPGLLQTEDYARAIIAAGRPDSVDDRVAARMSRQSLLEGEDRPRAWFVMDEQALRRPLTAPDAWRAQLEKLLKAAQQPRTIIQVIPARRPWHPGVAGPFTIFTLDGSQDVLFEDGFSQGRMVVDAVEVGRAADAYDLLRAVALSPDESAELIDGHLGRIEPHEPRK